MDKLHENYTLKNKNSFGVEGAAEYFYEFETNEEISDFVKQKLNDFKSVKILGSGCNILLTNNVKGVVIQSQNQSIEVVDDLLDYAILKVGAALDWDTFVAHTLDQKLYGLENLSLIPSSVGATPVQNIGAYGVEVKDFIDHVEVINFTTGEIYQISNSACNFGYRDSIFKDEANANLMILYVFFKLAKTFTPNLTYQALNNAFTSLKNCTASQVREKVIEIRNSKLPDHKKIGNAGSFFKNPIVEWSFAQEIMNQYKNIPHWEVAPDKIKFSAAWLIDQCGFKGYVTEKGAGVYKDQALVLINAGNAKGSDIMELALFISKMVYGKFRIELKPEVNLW
ncbi:MAG: UDP-N-acetylmuramate dehydrogenase [Salinivirgaceae bacterium]|nr:UDP-N-acetylmuramate dehydrogenase [Salinivirgaceae bacterium]MDD4747923.1 UDP-N-acetylmuramate dehydrogenase [Salinivirgaceae bacterium]MDY0279067.1 UDP-N-acetylmuramate dehydrogenase [Salinivirgaceae bacterium]